MEDQRSSPELANMCIVKKRDMLISHQHLLDFRVRKENLQEIVDLLWPRLGLFLDGDNDEINA